MPCSEKLPGNDGGELLNVLFLLLFGRFEIERKKVHQANFLSKYISDNECGA